LTDTDSRPGYVSSVLRFGPNAVNGEVNERGILGYAAFMIDDCGRTMGDPVAVVSRRASTYTLCCQHDVYSVPFTAVLPVNVTGVAIMVLPNTTAGLLPIGETTNVIEDLAVMSPIRAVASAGVRRHAHRGAHFAAAALAGARLALAA